LTGFHVDRPSPLENRFYLLEDSQEGGGVGESWSDPKWTHSRRSPGSWGIEGFSPEKVIPLVLDVAVGVRFKNGFNRIKPTFRFGDQISAEWGREK